MIAEEDRPIGAPALPERRRDRLSVFVAEHGWAETLSGNPRESLPAELAEHFPEPPDPRYDARYVRPQ